MKKNLNYILMLCLGITLASCGESAEDGENESAKGHLITGHVSGADGKTVTLLVFENGGESVIDSAVVTDGTFELETQTKELREYLLFFENEMPVVLFLDEKSENVTIEGSIPGIGTNYTVSGSAYSSGIRDYLLFLEQFYAQETDLINRVNAMNPADSNGIKPLMAQLDSISGVQRKYAIERIEKDPASPVSWMLLRELIPASGLLGFDSTDLDYFQQVASGMRERYPYSEYPTYIESDIESIRQQIAMMNAPAPEMGEAPEIVLNDVNGKPIALSSLRGKVVLVDFWASWCGPCRQENPNVVRLYETYKKEGFTVYSVSLDENRSAWMKAIEADNLSWPNHVSDLKGWASEAAIAYEVNAIPSTFLLDREGKIVARNLRGQQLEQKLLEVLF